MKVRTIILVIFFISTQFTAIAVADQQCDKELDQCMRGCYQQGSSQSIDKCKVKCTTKWGQCTQGR